MRWIHSWTLALGIAAFCIGGSSIATAQEAASTPAATSIASDELPDSPGTTWARLQDSSQQDRAGQQGTGQPATAQPAPSAAAPAADHATATQGQSITQEQPKLQRPVGTAAAEAPKVSGVTAAQPAGVAIAPAKQRRVRILVLKVGAILGASAAIGTVVALSAATPSKPPGAH